MFLSVAAGKSTAHELQPTITDVFVTDAGELVFELRINLEAFLSGVNLDAVANTDDDVASDIYDDLRALPAEEIIERAGKIIEVWNAYPLATAGGPVVLSIRNVAAPQDLDFELPRISEVRVSGRLPEGASAIVVNWPPGSGPLVLRQQGVDAPYTGFLTGGASSPEIRFSVD